MNLIFHDVMVCNVILYHVLNDEVKVSVLLTNKIWLNRRETALHIGRYTQHETDLL